MASHAYSGTNGYGLPSYNREPQQPASVADGAQQIYERVARYNNGPGQAMAWRLARRVIACLRVNLAPRRLLSIPHLLVAMWMVVMLWGERWKFTGSVQSCDWDHWEKWPAGATPHHLIFVADPQLIDPHSYPGRPWPLNPLTYAITDNYLWRSYRALQSELRPDTVMFLGDLFDGGREWSTAHEGFDEPEWMRGERPASEEKYARTWLWRYGEDFWLREYARFGHIFYDNWELGGIFPGQWQRGKKIISSLPGNHDLGFGPGVKQVVRNRFSAYFGDTNRVDVIGNHTFVSVDTVSLAAGTHSKAESANLRHIYDPARQFLGEVKGMKRRAAAREVKFWRGEVEAQAFAHKVEDIGDTALEKHPSLDQGENGPDFPTILLSHVPLYRDPGTPCGPMREHWPPTKPPKGQTTPVDPDMPNALHSLGRGYQYQNALTEDDSVRLIKSIGNVVHAFSGDDHDYCDIVHTESKEKVREIIVKSISMAMGVPTPGFQMVSLYNPIDENGKSLLGEGKPTIQTHLCLLPQQLSTYTTYAALGILTVVLLVIRALLVPVLNLQPFALDATSQSDYSGLPMYNKAKVETDPEVGYGFGSESSGKSTSKFIANRTRGRAPSVSNGSSRGPSPRTKGDKWGWAENRGPRIEIRRDVYDGGKSRGFQWQAARRSNWRNTLKSRSSVIVREIWTTTWRVVWMSLAFFIYLGYKG